MSRGHFLPDTVYIAGEFYKMPGVRR